MNTENILLLIASSLTFISILMLLQIKKVQKLYYNANSNYFIAHLILTTIMYVILTLINLDLATKSLPAAIYLHLALLTYLLICNALVKKHNDWLNFINVNIKK